MRFYKRRTPRPTPAEIINATLATHDYKTAALFLAVGVAELITEIRAREPRPQTTEQSTRTLQIALAKVLSQ